MTAADLPDGVHDGVPFAEYLAIPAVSNSGVLKRMRRSALYCRETEGKEQESTKAMRAGSIVNDLVLVPHLWPERFTIMGSCVSCMKGTGEPCTKPGTRMHGGRPYCGTKGHAPDGESDDDPRILVTQDDVKRATAMAEAVKSSEEGAPILAECDRREVTILWTDRATGLRCKGRVDLLGGTPVSAQAWDLKKSNKASPSEFERELLKRGYHAQLAWYDDGLRAHGWLVDVWGLLVVNDQKGDDVHEVGAYPLVQDALELGRAQNRETLARYAECLSSGRWPGFGTAPISVPQWAIGRDDEDEDAAVEGALEVASG